MTSWFERFDLGHRYSYITTEFPDKNQFPKFYDAKRIEITLEPGEMLYIPSGWYHWVFSEEPDPETGLNASINYWYKDVWDMTKLDVDTPIKTTHNIHKIIDYMNFLKTLGDRKLGCSSSNNGTFTLPQMRWIHNDTVKCDDHYLTFAEFYEKKNSNDKNWYLWGISDDRLGLYDPKITNYPLKHSNWWVNFGNVNTSMHYDGDKNMVCQIAGKKRFVLFPHSEWNKLYLVNPYPPEMIHHIMKFLTLPQTKELDH